MEYIPTTLNDILHIQKIYTIHYFEYSKDFKFLGERHNFWEFLYVDKGKVNVFAEDKTHLLSQGEIIFHKPNEFHGLSATGSIAPNLIVISFSCSSPAIKFFKDKILSLSFDDKALLSQIIKEAKKTYKKGIENPYEKTMTKHSDIPFGSEQLIRTYLYQFLINLYRENTEGAVKHINLSHTKKIMDKTLIDNIIGYMKNELSSRLTLGDIVKYANLSPTTLKTIFKKETGMGIIKYYNILKTEQAKTLIREGRYNFTEISIKLGYDSVHYFSRQFKNLTGMSPREYAKSTKITF